MAEMSGDTNKGCTDTDIRCTHTDEGYTDA